MLKAYQITNDYEDIEDLCSPIVFTETAGQAKHEFYGGTNLDYTEIRVRRAKWADQYAEDGVIPVEAWFDNGYRVPCAECEYPISEKEDCIIEDNRAICLECYKWIRGEE